MENKFKEKAKEFESKLLESKRDLEERLNDVRRTIDSVTSDAKHRVESTAFEAASFVGNIGESVDDLKIATLDKVKDKLKEVDAYLPTLTRLGYKVQEVEINLELPPSVTLLLKSENVVSEAEAAKILQEDHKEKAMLNSIISAVMQAEKLKVGGMKCSEIKVVLGLLPKATLKFN